MGFVNNQNLLLQSFIFLSTILIVCHATCPCKSEELCKPVTKNYTKELVVFSCATDPNEWKSYNWSEITHVILCNVNKDYTGLYCHAHANQVRVTQLAGLHTDAFPHLGEASFRKNIIDGWLNETTSFYFDGVNMDVEGAAFTNDVVAGITQLTKETREAYKKANSNYVVTFDIPYSPYLAGCISKYCFDYVGISKYTDYMIVMDYDANIDIFMAQANSPFFLVEEGLDFYIKNLSIDPQSLVMAVPWYGYDFQCKEFLNRTGNELCLILGAGHIQRCFSSISPIIKNNSLPIHFNGYSKSVFVTLLVDGVYHQIWFDNSKSLSYKYDLAKKLDLKGLSMWRSDCLDYTTKEPYVVNETFQYWSDITNAMVQLKKSKSNGV